MIDGSLGMIIEGLVSVLLVATIFYCISVNRKLERLRHEQKGMYSFIKELSLATANADKAIRGLRDTVEDSGAELAGQIDKGSSMSRQLKLEMESAEQTMKKLIVLTGSANSAMNGARSAPGLFQETEPLVSVDALRQSMLGFDDLEGEGGAPAISASSDLLVGVRGAMR
ncbi:MAG: DUF6468 domain-containing protein [Hyphomicrobiaceae bacterium]|nr:DUF6468 domain-containing protein [Hyphomicrobiaceae bacterium]